MTPERIAATLTDDSRLILPVGTCERYHPALPMGCATLIVDALADDLSAEFGVLRAPTLEYGVNEDDETGYLGQVSVRKKTLHRTLNDILASWETHGVTEFVLLTAHGHDPHQEAIATVATIAARVRVIDLFAVNLSDLIGHRRQSDNRSGLYLSLLQYLAPELIDGDAEGATAEDGRLLYERIRARISERVFLAPTPVE